MLLIHYCTCLRAWKDWSITVPVLGSGKTSVHYCVHFRSDKTSVHYCVLSIIVFISGQERLQSIILLVSGSGKTLAYLLPALNMLMQRRESTALVEESVNTPSIIILTPTRELADQVMVSITVLLLSLIHI